MLKKPTFDKKNTRIYSILISSLCVLGVAFYTPSFFDSRVSNANFDFFSDLVRELDLGENLSKESGVAMDEEINDPVDPSDRTREILATDEVETMNEEKVAEILLDNEISDGPVSLTDGGGNPYLNRWLDVTENQIKFIGPVNPNIIDFCNTASTSFSTIPNIIYSTVYNGTNASTLSNNDLKYCTGGQINRSTFRSINPSEKLVLNINVPGGSTTRKWEVSVYFRNRSFGNVVDIPLKATVAGKSTTLELRHDGNIHHKSTYQDNFVIDTPGFHKLELENTDTNGRPILLTFVKIKSIPAVEVPTLNISKSMVGYSENQQINWNTLPANKEVAYRIAWSTVGGNLSLGDLDVTDIFSVEGQQGTKIYDYLSFSNLSGVAPTDFEFIPGSSTLKWKLLSVPAGATGAFEVKFKVKDIRAEFNCSLDNNCGPFNVLNKVIIDSPNDMFFPLEATHQVKYISPKAVSLYLENYSIGKSYPSYVNVTSNGGVMESGVTSHSFTLRLDSSTGVTTATNVKVALSLLSNSSRGWNGGRMDLGTIRVLSPNNGVRFEVASETFEVALINASQPIVVVFDAYYNKNHGSKSVPEGGESKLESQVAIVGLGSLGINYYNLTSPVFAGLKGSMVNPFSITKTVDKLILNYPADGNKLNYTIKVKNNSNTAQVANIEDVLPQVGNTGKYLLPKIYPNGTVTPDNKRVYWNSVNFAAGEEKVFTLRAEVPGSIGVGTYNLNNIAKVSLNGFDPKEASALTVLNIASVNALYLENYQVSKPYPEYVNVSSNGSVMISGIAAHSFTLRVETASSTPITVTNIIIPLAELRNNLGYQGGALDYTTVKILSPASGVTYDESTMYFQVNSVMSGTPVVVNFEAYYNRTLGSQAVPNDQESILENEVKIYSTSTPQVPFYNYATPIRVGLKGLVTSMNLVATKTVSPSSVTFPVGTTSNAGKVFTYNIRVQNNGNTNMSNLVVKDLLPEGISFNEATFTATGGNAGVLSGSAITWDNVNITAGGVWAATVVAPVDVRNATFSSVGTYPLQNKVEVRSNTGTLLASTNVTSSVIVTSTVNLVATKTVSPSSVTFPVGTTSNAGKVFTYNIRVQNNGNVNISNLVVSDLMPTGIRFNEVTFTATGGNTGVLSGNTITWNNVSITVGGVWTATVVAPVDVTNATFSTAGTYSLQNRVEVRSSTGTLLASADVTSSVIVDSTSIGLDHNRRRRNNNRRVIYPMMPVQAPVYYSAVATGFPSVPFEGGLTITKEVSPSRVSSGKEALYTVQIKNQTGSLKVVDVYDSLGLKGDGVLNGTNGSKITYVKNSLKVTGSNFTGDIDKYEGLTLLDVEAGETVTLTYRAVAMGNGRVENEVSLTDGDYAKATLEISGGSNTAVSINKTANKSQVRPNDSVEYTLKVTNNTNEVAKAVNIKDALPQGLDFISSPNSELTANGRDLEVELGDLAPGESRIVRYTAKVDSSVSPGEKLPNEAGLTYIDSSDKLVGPIYARELVSVGGKVLFVLFVLFTAVALVRIVRLGREKRSFNF